MLVYYSSSSDANFIEFLEEICNDDLLNSNSVILY